jgi:hypothetical protein
LDMNLSLVNTRQRGALAVDALLSLDVKPRIVTRYLK